MKIQRSVIKNIVKECLIEILSEGIGLSKTPQVHEIIQKPKQQINPLVSEQRKSTAINEVVKIASAGNPNLMDVLADTLQTTYVQQQSAEMSIPTLNSLNEVSNADDDLDDNVIPQLATSKSWSNIAFGNKKK